MTINKPASFATGEFPWIEIGQDDYKCTLADCTLRVEKMGPSFWWWRVYVNSEAVSQFESETATSKWRAIGLAEGVYLGRFISYHSAYGEKADE